MPAQFPTQSIDQLKSSFRGELIQPSDAGYEAARKVYNGMIDKRPLLIARCVDVADVMAAVDFGRDNGMLTAIRGGGHNGAGLGTCDGRAGDRPVPHERHSRRSCGENSAG